MKLLLVEDDVMLGTSMEKGLARTGFIVDWVRTGQHARTALKTQTYDIVLLDLGLPDATGLELLKSWRQQNVHTPVLIVTARDGVRDRVEGLNLGADDYLAKPFSVLELVARVRALLRRSDALARNARMANGSVVLGDLQIDPVAREVLVGGRAVELTPREFDLLHFFARHPGKVYSRLELLNHVWGYEHDGYEHTVNTHINRLRVKVEADPTDPHRILTVWGHGYKLATEAGA